MSHRADPHHHRGQAIVELALIVPIAVLLLMGVLELGLLMGTKLNLQAATRNAARLGTIDAQSANADYDIIRAITTTQGLDPSRVVRIDIFKANPDGSLPTASNSEDWYTLTPTGGGAYTATAGLIDWPPGERRIVEPPQYLGVRLTYRYYAATPLFSVIGGVSLLTDQTVMRLVENKGLEFVQVPTPTDVPTDTPTNTPTNTPVPTNTPTATITPTPAPHGPPSSLSAGGARCYGATPQYASVVLTWTAPLSGTPSAYNVYDPAHTGPVATLGAATFSYSDTFSAPLSAPLAFSVTAQYSSTASTPVSVTLAAPCTATSSNLTLGYTTTGAFSDTSDITELVGSLATAPSGFPLVTSATPITLHAYLGSITDLSVAQFGVYSNVGNAPGQLLWTSATTTTLTATGLITVPLTAYYSGATLSAGGSYWLLMETATVDSSGQTHQIPPAMATPTGDGSGGGVTPLTTYLNYDPGGVSYAAPYTYTLTLPNPAPPGSIGTNNYTLYVSLSG